MAKVTDVAELAGVSPGLVSRLLNGDPTLRVREATRERVLAAAREIGYAPNHAARALRNSRMGLVGLALKDASNPVYAAMIAGAQTAAAEAGVALMLADVETLATDDATFLRFISSGAIDGLLLQRHGTRADELVTRIVSQRIPTILLNDHSQGPLGAIAVDDRAGAEAATRHLIELGHRDIGILQLDGLGGRPALRERGWADALAAAGIEPDADLVAPGGHTADSGYRGMAELLGRPRRPSAVFVSTALSAIGALSACARAGVRVPDDLSMVALHDFEITAYSTPALTTVRMPLFEMGYRAFELLTEALNGGAPRQEVLRDPPPLLIRRESSAAPRSAGGHR